MFERLVPQIELRCRHRRRVGGRGEPVPLVGFAETGVVARFADGLEDHRFVERSRPRVALARIGDDANADPFDPGDRERLDVAVEYLDVGLTGANDVRLDLLTGPRR